MKRVLFRADAKPSIGVGDLMSLIHLSQYFKEDGWDTHLMIRGYQAGLDLVDKHKVNKSVVIEPRCSISEEIRAINEYAEQNCIDLVFFEITERKLSDYKGLSDKFKKACICFDGHILNGMDLVVDWDVEADRFFNPHEHESTRFLLGPEFVILPKIFYSDRRIASRVIKPKARMALIAMGGADENNFTSIVSLFLLINKPNLYLNIIVGSGYQHVNTLNNKLKHISSNYCIKHNVDDMLKQYLMADVAIGAGGLTASELVATRTPCLLMATYEHQIARCRFFDENGYAVYLGYRSFEKGKLIHYIENPLIPENWPIFKTVRILNACNNIVL